MKYNKAKANLLKFCEKVNVDKLELNPIILRTLNKPLTHFIMKDEISFLDYLKVKRVIYKRSKHQPLNYILKNQNFCGFNFYVNKHVLAPRPETELLVEKALSFIKGGDSVLDLCCGSGCIGISLKKLCEEKSINVLVNAVDISTKALKVAKKNAKQNNCEINFIKSDLFENIKEKYNIIVSNPPYINKQDMEKLDLEVKKYDPTLALYGGENGLDFYERIINDCKNYLLKNGFILFEIGMGQENDVAKLLQNKGFKTEVLKDYNGINRIVIGLLKQP